MSSRRLRYGLRALRAAILAGALSGLALPALAADIDARWKTVNESGEDFAVAEHQARASIYRGNHLLALRCHSEGARDWLTLVFSATWFVRPKEFPRFSLAVDEGDAVKLSFERETDYRFVSSNPPRQLLERLAGGSEVRIEGPDYEGAPVVLPLKGSRKAIDQALTLCRMEPLAKSAE